VRAIDDDARSATDPRATWSTVPLQRLCDVVLPARRRLLARAAAQRVPDVSALEHATVSEATIIGPLGGDVMVGYATGWAIARFYTTVAKTSEHAMEGRRRSTLSAKETRSQMVAHEADTALIRSRQPGQRIGRARSDARDRRLSRRPDSVRETAAVSSVPQRGVARIRQGAVFCQYRLRSQPRSLALVRCGCPALPAQSRHFWDLKHER
jgi:hypothetical protein